MKPDDQSFKPPSLRDTAGTVLAIARIWSTSIEVFIRKDMGSRYLGTRAFLVIPLVLLYSLLFNHYTLASLALFLVAYLLLVCFHRFKQRRRDRHGELGHSYYDGTPRLIRFLPRVDELTIKRRHEPFAVFMAGVLLLALDAPLAMYLIVGAVCMGLNVSARDYAERERLRDLQDALTEQRAISEIIRDRNANR